MVKLRFRHSRFIQEVFGASGYFAIDDAFHIAKVIINTDINDAQLEAMLATEHIDATTTSGKVYHLLPRYLTWTDANTLTLNAMVTT